MESDGFGFYDPLLWGSIRFWRQSLQVHRGITTTRLPQEPQPPAMGPRVRKNTAYQDAIQRIVEEDEDGEMPQPRTRQGTRVRLSRAKKILAAPAADVGNMEPGPPTAASKARAKKARERRRQDHLARNEDEREAHDIGAFFEDEPGHIAEVSHDLTALPENQPPSPREDTASIYDPATPQPAATPQRPHTAAISQSPFGRPRACLRPPRSRTANDVWHFFKRGATGTTCAYCKNPFEYSLKTTTGVLRDHIEEYHIHEYVEVCKQNGWAIKIKSLTSNYHESEPVTTPRPLFTMAWFKTALVNWIVADDQAIYVVECPEFRHMLLLLRETLSDKDIPHRTTIRSLIVRAWETQFEELKEELQYAAGKISLTTDGWDDKSMRAYIAVTAHYLQRSICPTSKTIQGPLEMYTALVGFLPMPGRHFGQDLAKGLVFVTDRAGITDKIGFITTDGASNMAAMVQDFEVILSNRFIDFESEERHIVCFPHRLHTSVTAMLHGCTNEVALQNTTNEFESLEREPENPDTQTMADALQRDPVAIARNIINNVRASQLRREEFKEVIEYGNRRSQWEDKDGRKYSLPVLALLRDSPLRWGSTYIMLERFLFLQAPIRVYLNPGIISKLFKSRLTPREWKVLESIKEILEPAHALQSVMCSESTPVLACVVPAFDSLLSAWSRMCEQPAKSHLRPMLQAGIDKLCSQYNDTRFSKSSIICIVLHPALRFRWLEENWPEHHVVYAKRVIKEELRQYRENHLDAQPSHSAPKHHSPSKNAFNILFGKGAPHHTTGRPQHTPSVDEEFNSYCHAPNWPDIYSLDLVSWWDHHKDHYPTLFLLSLDYLPAQASSVPSERAFSSSAETDTRRRNRISPDLMEKLQMLKFLLRKARLDFTAGWKCDEKDLELENDCEDGRAQTLSSHVKNQRLQNPVAETSSEQDSDDSLSSGFDV